MPTYVLDSFAVLALLNAEPGGRRVRVLFEEAAQEKIDLVMSLINLGEVVYLVERHHGLEQTRLMLAGLEETRLQYAAVDQSRVLAAAHLKAHHPISYADAFAAALARELGATLVTGDPEFARLEGEVVVEWLER
jgi:predicted nucleic acid-binding protein